MTTDNLQEMIASKAFEPFYEKLDQAAHDNQIKSVTVTKDNFTQYESLLENAYKNLYLPTFPDPTEQEPYERWKDDILLGAEAKNVRLITLFYQDQADGEKKVSGVAASELYRTPTEHNPNAVTLFPNYYFSGKEASKAELDPSQNDNRNPTFPPIPTMFLAQLRDAKALTDQMAATGGKPAEITGIFFEADDPVANKIKFLKEARNALGSGHSLLVEDPDLLDQMVCARTTADRAILDTHNMTTKADREDLGLTDKQAKLIDELGGSYDQIKARHRMYQTMQKFFDTKYLFVPNYAQPELEKGKGRCNTLVGRFLGEPAQAKEFLNQFYEAFEGKTLETLAERSPTLRKITNGLDAADAQGKGGRLELTDARAEHIATRAVKQLSASLPRERPSVGKFTEQQNGRQGGWSQAFG